MADFSAKQIGGTSLGEALRAYRMASGWSLAELARASRVQEKYLEAFEAGDFEALPDASYQRTFLRAVAETLAIEEGPLLARHAFELRQAVRVTKGRAAPPRAASRLAFLVGPRIALVVAVLAVVLGALGLLGWQVSKIVLPPALTVTSPADDARVADPTVMVSGVTEREAELRIGGEPVFLTEDGTFNEPVHLHRGVNVITIASKKPHSDEAVVYRRVMWEPEGE